MKIDSFYIFVVGCPASGKTTLAKEIIARFPAFSFHTDLTALDELFFINDSFNTTTATKKSGINELISKFKKSTLFWQDLIDEYNKMVVNGTSLMANFATVRTSDGGHDILTPGIWDEIILRALKKIKDTDYYIFEFSRGYDQKYEDFFKVSTFEIYNRCFTIIKKSMPQINQNNSLIIHVHANEDIRYLRNSKRKMKGEHFVSDEVMKNVYKNDVFKFEIPSPNRNNIGHLSEILPIPVISVDNSHNDELKNSFLFKYLDKILLQK